MSEEFPEYEYTPPTRDVLVRSMHGDGLYIGVCRKCKQKVKASSEKELMSHKCDGEARVYTNKWLTKI